MHIQVHMNMFNIYNYNYHQRQHELHEDVGANIPNELWKQNNTFMLHPCKQPADMIRSPRYNPGAPNF